MGELAVATRKASVYLKSGGKGYLDWVKEGRQVSIIDSDGK